MNTAKLDLVVTGLVQCGDVWKRREVHIANGKITAIADPSATTEATRRLDVGNAYVLPGMVDAHVHSLSHPGEGVAASTQSAAAGGVTTIVEMPFDLAGPINTVERIKVKRELVETEAFVDVAMMGTLAPEGGWRAAEAISEAGAVGFKVSLFNTDAARFPRIDDAELRNVMAATGAAGRTVAVHAENNEIVQAMLAIEKERNPFDPKAHVRSRPPVSETMGVLTALEIAFEQSAKLHLCHLSLPRSVDLVNWYRDQGLDVTLETCPHYLTFTEDDHDAQRGRLKINPPLRKAADRQGMWERLSTGKIDVVSSDHAPWPTEYKDHEGIFANHSGAPGVQTSMAITLSAALERGPEAFNAAVKSLTSTPAQRFGVGHVKGSLEVGFDADIAVFDPDTAWHIDAGDMFSNAGWTPFQGIKTSGRVTTTISRGSVVWDGSAILGVQGHGTVVQSS
ncbi:dihydroorotase family protein [Arthrobacter sp. STN4]|uniref:dihydroorotase n=1 Tax=Arthrobacter sp. STN4 TaxID=2923276 RepID=UPI00211A8129|nr:amidohydrolase family protein [Arthrobacter sp. STN4]MCQ9163919.1 amidohydrolase family protein [Arthrobacter sp. STN4]